MVRETAETIGIFEEIAFLADNLKLPGVLDTFTNYRNYLETLNISFRFDCRCFFGTILKVLKHKGVVEGGTGTLHEEKEPVGK